MAISTRAAPPLLVLLFLISISSSLEDTSADTHYAVVNKASNEAGGVEFDQILGSDQAEGILSLATQFIQNVLYVGEPSVPQKQVNKLTLYVDDQPSRIGAAAFTVDDGVHRFAIHLSESYVAGYSGDVATEIEGVLYHEMTHVWQWDGQGAADSGLTEGMADYIRLTANLQPSNWGQPGEGDRWDEGYSVTAYFLQYCESLQAGFVRSLNAKLATGWDVSYFEELLGKTVHQLWQSYKQKYEM